MADRILLLAEVMAPALAELAGRAIRRDGKLDPYRRQIEINAIMETFMVRERGTACCLTKQLFSPVTPWSVESVVASARLLYAAFCAALEQKSIWDRRLSARTIKVRIRRAMLDHIKAFAKDRGMDMDEGGKYD